MNFLECPSLEVWESRRCWFEEQNDSIAGEGSYFVSEQACALLGEVQTAFCAGAWVAVIVMVLAVIDAQLRETELPGFKGNTKELLHAVGANLDLQQLRERRNAIIHLNPQHPAITVDEQWSNRALLEKEARKTVILMFETFYISPWV